MDMKQKHKGWRWAAALAVLAAALLVGVVARCKPDWVFVAKDTVTHLGVSAPWQQVQTVEEAGLVPYDVAALEAEGTVTFDQSLMLINSDHPLPEEFAPQLVELDTDTQLNEQAAQAYAALKQAVEETYGQHLYLRSAYRTAEEQAETVEEDGDVAAAVGASEHQAGLGMDVYVPYYGGGSFIKCAAGQFVNTDCWRYGLIIRYPYYGTAETGLGYEPWHLRYVGAPHAELMTKNRWTLEEYLQQLELGQVYTYGDYHISHQSGEGGTVCLPEQLSEEITISPDNLGGYVIVW